MAEELLVPEDADNDWAPPGYEPGPDDPGPVTAVHEHGDGPKTLTPPPEDDA